MCKAGQIHEGYEIALNDWNNDSENVWTHREVGWALYYLIKHDVENRSHDNLYEHLEKFSELTLLDMSQDKLIFENVLWKLSECLREVPSDNLVLISNIFSKIHDWRLGPSRSYSYFIQNCLKFEGWEQMATFIEWWNIDNLQPEDYQPFKMENGRTVMALAERVLIAYSKALMRLRDQVRIDSFIPRLESTAEQYPDMIYLGYFCGKLLIAQGASAEDALNRLVPFVRKKESEFWAWQVLSEIFRNDVQKRFACLLRAVHCRTQESFLGKIRIALAEIYVSQNDLPRAKYHIDKVSICYLQHGWRIPNQIQQWTIQPWLSCTVADSSDPIDYKAVTDGVLYNDTEKRIALVTYVDTQAKRASLIYGMRQKQTVKYSGWGFAPSVGMVLNVESVLENHVLKVINVERCVVGADVSFMKEIFATVDKRQENQFAFIKNGSEKYFVSPSVVSKYNLNGGEVVNAIVAFDFNKKKNEWSWTCVHIKN